MTKTKPGRNPFRKTLRPIRQELLAQIRIDQPFADRSVKHRKPRKQIPQNLLDLILRKAPLHTPNVRNRCERNRPKTQPIRKKSEKSQLPSMGRPTVSASRSLGSISL